jgi:hypothetical protein
MFRFVDSLTWRTYSEIFKKGIWTASAFKVIFILKFLRISIMFMTVNSCTMSSSKEYKDFFWFFIYLLDNSGSLWRAHVLCQPEQAPLESLVLA